MISQQRLFMVKIGEWFAIWLQWFWRSKNQNVVGVFGECHYKNPTAPAWQGTDGQQRKHRLSLIFGLFSFFQILTYAPSKNMSAEKTLGYGLPGGGEQFMNPFIIFHLCIPSPLLDGWVGSLLFSTFVAQDRTHIARCLRLTVKLYYIEYWCDCKIVQAWFIDLRKWNSSRFEGGVRYLYEPNFDATAKDYESCLQNGMQCGSSLLFNWFHCIRTWVAASTSTIHLEWIPLMTITHCKMIITNSNSSCSMLFWWSVVVNSVPAPSRH